MGQTKDTECRRGRHVYACATEPQWDGPQGGTCYCSTNNNDCFQSYFNELKVCLLLASWHELSSHWKAIHLAAQKMQIMRAKRTKFSQLCPPLKASLEEGEASRVSKQPSGWDSSQCFRLPHGHRDFPGHLQRSERCSFDSTRTWGTILGAGLHNGFLDLSENLGDPLAF